MLANPIQLLAQSYPSLLLMELDVISCAPFPLFKMPPYKGLASRPIEGAGTAEQVSKNIFNLPFHSTTASDQSTTWSRGYTIAFPLHVVGQPGIGLGCLVS